VHLHEITYFASKMLEIEEDKRVKVRKSEKAKIS
jgi:hypothetical protein